MDFVTDIEKPILIWVRKVELDAGSQPRLWGSAIAGTDGLGDKDHCTGDFSFVHANGSTPVRETSIGRMHVNSIGFPWQLTSAHLIHYPTPPFIITSIPNLRFTGTWKITFEAAEAWGELEEDDQRWEEFWLCTPDWLGILRVDKTKSCDQGELTLFSDRVNAVIHENQVMFFSDYPEQAFGKVVSAKPLK